MNAMDLVQGNPTEVKVVLARVATALAIYQLVLISIVYRKLRPSLLQAEPAAFTHRASARGEGRRRPLVAQREPLPARPRHHGLRPARRHLGQHGGGVPRMKRQLIGSLLVAAIIVAVTIITVTAQLGPTSAAELEAQEERPEELLELQEERREDRD
jgi:hypothetical protein